MFDDHSDVIRDIALEAGLVTPAQAEEVWESTTTTGKSFGDSLVDAGYAERGAILQAIADHLGSPYYSTVPADPGEALVKLLKPAQAHKYVVLPVADEAGKLTLLAKDPFNSSVINELSFILQREIELGVADPAQVDAGVVRVYGEATSSSMEDLLGEFGEVDAAAATDEDVTKQASQAPIIRFVDLVLQEGVKAKASDIHFEPFEHEFRIRLRIDGSLYEMAPPPKNLASAVIARVKVLSSLNIAERRIPQDGRIKTTISGRQIDLRVSTLPTQFGESVVLRILDKSVVNLSLEALSMQDDIKEGIRGMVGRPNGIFIVTGPTGSGKTTTLYSALKEVNTEDVKILTAEDPVEYEVEGIMQVPINHQVGLTFAAALRSFLRQDPDTIMVGEIRDIETAQIAVQASLTGHVVLSTLHTNDAPGAVTRLIDMGLEPFLISASLEGVLAQRLLRRICKTCRTPYEPDKDVVNMLDVDALEIANKKFYYGKGCPDCSRSGYKGRQGLFELMTINDQLRALITQKAPTLVLKQKAIESGMRPLRDDGLRCIFDGHTSIEEVLKYT
ncbi:MAG: GspE/PulE family protein [Opitutales bacterium]|jgi:type IV pilus assembly protein PilB|nr:GspE/PulE family protein [Opitutales bacterium]MDP4659417.1 GspE/PulE family protein [Opitutales bacterium]MDP4774955.1 GspE/PulE family protein [Opitutales bacterium]MDP4787924.1 GspE/PulE family protein [Opitutales bacterium]MDP4861568.1 GspE/PulE family protein [Opitutales bacterium]